MTRQLTVTLETVTPLFLAGADNQKPELRPPSVRGQLRYWLRAALGAVVGDDLAALKQAEAEVFGDTNGTGAVSVRVRWLDKQPSPVEKAALPHHSEKNRQAWMKGFPAGEKFELVLTQRGGDSATWLAAISSLFLMVSIGGLGRRCRRGWGTVRVLKSNDPEAGLNQGWRNVLQSKPPDSIGTWTDYLSTSLALVEYGIEPLRKKLNIKPKSVQLPTPYTIATSKLVVPIITRNVYFDPIEAIRDFGQREHNFGAGHAFGSANPRQGSPLWVRVLPVAKPEQGYVLSMTFFDVAFGNRDPERIQQFLSQWDAVKAERQK